MDTYKSISKITEGLYKEKGSKFLSFAIPVSNVDQVKEIVKEYRKQYFDARHVCYAYMIGMERKNFRANDDGEPSGTAGRPILGQLNSRELSDVLVIVVRYFGGVLLGTGGLVVAYKEATIDALNNAKIIEKVVEEKCKIRFNYLVINNIMHLIKEYNVQIRNQDFNNHCVMEVIVRKQNIDAFITKMKKIKGVEIEKKNDE
jgi:uncharacterized YigZ family protein